MRPDFHRRYSRKSRPRRHYQRHGSSSNILIATYTDGSLESFDIPAGTPLSNGDRQISTATLSSQGATYPNSIDITSDGHFAIFGDTSTSLNVEVADISSGRILKTTVYKSKASISSSNIVLSPDETTLYVADTQGAAVTALFFDKKTGKLSPGCTSGRIAGQSQNWSYLGSIVPISQTGNGGGVYVAEFGSISGIAMVTISYPARSARCGKRRAHRWPIPILRDCSRSAPFHPDLSRAVDELNPPQ